MREGFENNVNNNPKFLTDNTAPKFQLLLQQLKYLTENQYVEKCSGRS